MRKLFRLAFAAPILLAAVAGSVRAEALKVFAAASLKEAFEAAADLYERENPGEEVELNFAGSQVLKQQLRQGAPADVFASADQATMDELKKAGLASGDQIFARNRLALVAPKDGTVAALADAARPGVKVVVADGNVPVGRYTAQVLGRMAKDGLTGEDYQKRVQANTVSQETSVRSVLMKVALGEADAGFVYVTDAATMPDKVRVIPIPDRVNVLAAYPIAVLSKSASPEKGRAFTALLLGEKGQGLLKERGFLPPR